MYTNTVCNDTYTDDSGKYTSNTDGKNKYTVCKNKRMGGNDTCNKAGANIRA